MARYRRNQHGGVKKRVQTEKKGLNNSVNGIKKKDIKD